ncbi:MAG TPA: 4-(cytidine 5'-diphospho)-2-C-methyl-D-erythritol kinase [Chitinophagaceae bacterium]
MVVFPNCKINLGLNVVRKRPDGFHDIETVFYPLKLVDALEIIENNSSQDDILFSNSGIDLGISAHDNLCVRAYKLVKEDFQHLPPIKMHLHKMISVGAGLGGGSADAAFTLKLLNTKFNLGLSTEKLLDYALQLGSDCPFFILNKSCFASGRGELLEEIIVDLSSFKFISIDPGININTAWAFSLVTSHQPIKSTKAIIRQPPETWRNELKNDFEEIVFKEHPQLKTLKNNFYKMGAVFCSMSGTGSHIYALFKKDFIPDIGLLYQDFTISDSNIKNFRVIHSPTESIL